jgi:hypothetical protein
MESNGVGDKRSKMLERRLIAFMVLMERGRFSRENQRQLRGRNPEAQVGVFRAVARVRFVKAANSLKGFRPHAEGE